MEIEEPMNRSALILNFIRGAILTAIFLLIDALIFWLAWTYILQPKFSLPMLSLWETVGLMYTYKLIFAAKKD